MLGAVLGAVGSLASSIFGNKAAEDQADLQREFAQNGIRWKVNDAIKAGIHPLYALGAQTTAYSPVTVGGADWGGVGQNIGSAIDSMRTPAEKADGFTKTVQGLTLQKMGLENELLASQVRLVNQPARGPGMPGTRMIDGQGNTPDADVLKTGFGVELKKAAGLSPASDWENFAGEPGDWIGGILNILHSTMKQELGATSGLGVGQNMRREIDRSLANWLANSPDANQSLRKAMGN